MNNIISRYSIITLSIFTFTFSQQERLMWENLVDKKGIKYAAGSKKPFTGRVFDNYKNKIITASSREIKRYRHSCLLIHLSVCVSSY